MEDDDLFHYCELPSLADYTYKDSKRIEKARWMCPECKKVYKPWETEMGMGPIYEWARLWPWSEWWWRRKNSKD